MPPTSWRIAAFSGSPAPDPAPHPLTEACGALPAQEAGQESVEQQIGSQTSGGSGGLAGQTVEKASGGGKASPGALTAEKKGGAGKMAHLRGVEADARLPGAAEQGGLGQRSRGSPVARMGPRRRKGWSA